MSSPIHLDFNQAPADIVEIMDETRAQAAISQAQAKQYRRLLWILFFAGLAMFLVDFLLGYNFLTCSIVGVVLILLTLGGRYLLRHRLQPPRFGSQFDLTRDLLHTIRDDIPAKKTIVGQLDLTGPRQESKRYRQKKAASGRPVSYYRDEWLKLKGNLYDGNVLRLSLVEKEKVREGFYKRSRISGKRKWKTGSSNAIHMASIGISANPDRFVVPPVDLTGRSIPESRFAVAESAVGQGRVSLKLVASQPIGAWDVLNALQFAYQHIEPRQPKPGQES